VLPAAERGETIDVDELYPTLAAAGLAYGPAFRGVRAAWHEGDDLCADLVLPQEAGDPAGYLLHPALFDAALHLVPFLGLDPRPRARLPFVFSDVGLHAAGASTLRLRLRRLGPDT
ncbi:polyketide synthase dehydratase domain-containing protein, partial [Amycolatopsis sp. SID8362]|uniref:polyketide synthase dehydratase domain-containing protein n=1 Tax=Amycolatopsis sp. SID8362 TaxID=2690346 RepID=UPI00136FC6C8